MLSVLCKITCSTKHSKKCLVNSLVLISASGLPMEGFKIDQPVTLQKYSPTSCTTTIISNGMNSALKHSLGRS